MLGQLTHAGSTFTLAQHLGLLQPFVGVHVLKSNSSLGIEASYWRVGNGVGFEVGSVSPVLRILQLLVRR